MADEEKIRERIEVRVSQGEFLAGMLHVAARGSANAQQNYIDRLSEIATAVRGMLEANGLIGTLTYRPESYWKQLAGTSIAFLDGGVASIDLPSAAPIGIRVGSYIVTPGEPDPQKREQFNIELSMVDDLYSDDAAIYDDDFSDIAKLRDAARIISETSAAWHLANRGDSPDLILLHGPLINPAAPYGLDYFPGYGLEACGALLNEPTWRGQDEERQFVALYLELLNRLKLSGKAVAGVVERSIGKDPVVMRRVLDLLLTKEIIKKSEARDLLANLALYALNDAALLDVVLQAGEYIGPISVPRQGPENKWPEVWKPWIRMYPNAFTTYLKPTDLAMPFRVEMFDDVANHLQLLDLILHTSRLLPSYGFPVGLDIVDKYAKVPEWMSRGIRGQHQIVLLKKALASGDPRALTFAKRVLASKGRDWFFRPNA
ncbi:MAG TPA: DNA double-strand break repair nuclease NurA [Croceibacterium sp.]|nr:DNA double-strand break repair nuclease NurA [Croceibacterium sp.]